MLRSATAPVGHGQWPPHFAYPGMPPGFHLLGTLPSMASASNPALPVLLPVDLSCPFDIPPSSFEAPMGSLPGSPAPGDAPTTARLPDKVGAHAGAGVVGMAGVEGGVGGGEGHGVGRGRGEGWGME